MILVLLDKRVVLALLRRGRPIIKVVMAEVVIVVYDNWLQIWWLIRKRGRSLIYVLLLISQ